MGALCIWRSACPITLCCDALLSLRLTDCSDPVLSIHSMRPSPSSTTGPHVTSFAWYNKLLKSFLLLIRQDFFRQKKNILEPSLMISPWEFQKTVKSEATAFTQMQHARSSWRNQSRGQPHVARSSQVFPHEWEPPVTQGNSAPQGGYRKPDPKPGTFWISLSCPCQMLMKCSWFGPSRGSVYAPPVQVQLYNQNCLSMVKMFR